jgi:hypothetical protein
MNSGTPNENPNSPAGLEWARLSGGLVWNGLECAGEEGALQGPGCCTGPFVRACACQRAIAGGVASSPFRYHAPVPLTAMRVPGMLRLPDVSRLTTSTLRLRAKRKAGRGPATADAPHWSSPYWATGDWAHHYQPANGT